MARVLLQRTIATLDGANTTVHAGATCYIYEPGTTTPIAQTLYASDTGSATLSNPLTADSAGTITAWLKLGQRVRLKGTTLAGSTFDLEAQAGNPDPTNDPDRWNAKTYGAKGDGKQVTDGVLAQGSTTLTSASAAWAAADVGKLVNVISTEAPAVVTDGAISISGTTLTSASAAWTSADVGKLVVVTGADSGGGYLWTTISARISSTQVTLAHAAGASITGAIVAYGKGTLTTTITARLSATQVTVAAAAAVAYSPATVTYGTDDTSKFQDFLDACSAAKVNGSVPPGRFMLNGIPQIGDDVVLVGAGETGTILDLNAVASTVYVVGSRTRVRGLCFEKLDQDAGLLAILPDATPSVSTSTTTPHDVVVEQCRFITNGSNGIINTATVGVYGANSGTPCRDVTIRGNYIQFGHVAIINKYGGVNTVIDGTNRLIQKGSDWSAEATKLEIMTGASKFADNVITMGARFATAITVRDSGVDGLAIDHNTIYLTSWLGPALTAYGAGRGMQLEETNANISVTRNDIFGTGFNGGIYVGDANVTDLLIGANRLFGAYIETHGLRSDVINNDVVGVAPTLTNDVSGTLSCSIRVSTNAHRVKGNTVRKGAQATGTHFGILAAADAGGSGYLDISENTVLDSLVYAILELGTDTTYIDSNLVKSAAALTAAIKTYNPGATKIVTNNTIDCPSAVDGILVESVTLAIIAGNVGRSGTRGIKTSSVTTRQLSGNSITATTAQDIEGVTSGVVTLPGPLRLSGATSGEMKMAAFTVANNATVTFTSLGLSSVGVVEVHYAFNAEVVVVQTRGAANAVTALVGPSPGSATFNVNSDTGSKLNIYHNGADYVFKNNALGSTISLVAFARDAN